MIDFSKSLEAFKEYLKSIKDNNYINILIDRIEYKNNDTKRKMEQIRNIRNYNRT